MLVSMYMCCLGGGICDGFVLGVGLLLSSELNVSESISCGGIVRCVLC